MNMSKEFGLAFPQVQPLHAKVYPKLATHLYKSFKAQNVNIKPML